jgi:GNAT superfamily N-acetyltransferase
MNQEKIAHFEIRPAEEKDIPVILGFIKELAEYERLSHMVVATEESLREELFGKAPVAETIIGYYRSEPVCFALFFYNFSTFLGQRGIYLEDLYVQPHMRGKGFGRALLIHLARLTQERNCGRLEWAVLDWNEPAINFYKRLGAVPMDDWTTFRLTGEELKRLSMED